MENSLALLSQETAENTFDEIYKGLYLNNNKTHIANQFFEYHKSLQTEYNSTITIINQIYVQNGYEIKNEFRKVAVEKFFSGVESINFSQPIESAQNINRFIENKTNNKIRDLLKPNMLNEQTKLVLINAIHFKSNWLYPFDKECTKQGNFYINENETVSAEFMCFTRPFNPRYGSYYKYYELYDLYSTGLGIVFGNT